MDVEVILHDSGELLPILLDGDGMNRTGFVGDFFI